MSSMVPKTKSERFVFAKKDQWQQLNTILLKINRNGFRALTPEEIRAFPRLSRLTCADLAEAKTLQLSPDVLDYLNQLVGQAHKFLYSFPPVKTGQIRRFFLSDLPFALVKNWIFFVVAAVIFFSSFAVTSWIVYRNPSLAGLMIPDTVLQEMEASYRQGITEERSASMKNFAVTFYIQNNVSIAFACFALGVLLGFGTLYVLLFNGVTLGAISGYIVALGYGKNFFTFVTAHTAAELLGVTFAGAAGLALGYSIIRATPYYRRDWLMLQRANIFTLVAASAVLLFLAAIIEGCISPSLLPYRVKAMVAVVSLLLIVGYFLVWPVISLIHQRKEKGRSDGIS
jgi:uncharacterized membrane protein SpoIIM required for sporulation